MKLSDFGRKLRVIQAKGGCRTCPRKLRDHVPATIKPGTDIIVVGEAPGETETKTMEGFTGRTGKYLRKGLHQQGITEYSLTNTIHCRPPNNRNPNKREIKACLSQFVMDEVEGFPLVVLVGNTPIKAFYPDAKPRNIRGNLCYHPDFPGQRFFGMYHPGYAVRDPKGERNYRMQLQRLGRIYRGEDETPFDVLDLKGRAFLAKQRAVLASNQKISFDIETDRLASWEPGGRIKSFAFTWDGETVMFAHEDDPWYRAALEAFVPFLEEPRSVVIGHHIGFDIDWMEHTLGFSCRARGIVDTGRLYYQYRGYKMPGLKMLVAQQLDGYRHYVHKPHECDNVAHLRMYNAEDVVYPWHLAEKALTGAKKNDDPVQGPGMNADQIDLFFKVGGPSDLFLQRITSTGIYYDMEAWERACATLDAERDEAIAAWQEADPEFSPAVLDGDQSLIEYIYTTKGLPVIKRTDGGDDEEGQPSTAKSTITELIRDYGATYLEHLLEVRKADKIKSTYLDGYPEKWVEQDGRIHADFLNTVTTSGRNASRSPNLQNIPRRRIIRSCYSVPEGYVMLQGDFSQIELRVMFSLANEERAIEEYNKGTDAHALTAMALTGKDTYTKQERTHAKPVNFGLLYGGNWRTLQRYARQAYGIDFSDAEAKEFADKFFRTYQRLKGYHAEIIQELRDGQGTIQTAAGHRWHYDKWNHPDDHVREHWERTAINTHGQGTAAYMTNYTGIQAQHYISEHGLYPAITMINTVHDSVMMQVREDVVPEAVRAMQFGVARCEEWTRDWFKVPLVLDFEIGPSWGELEERSAEELLAA